MPVISPDTLPPIAAIDIGTNSVHLIVARLDRNGHLTILDSDKAVLRLGAALTADNKFTSDTITRTIATISRMKEIASTYQPIFRAVATHATRVAVNHEELFSAIHKATGIQVGLIDGVEEARLVSLGMQHGLPLADRTFLGVDIGGGSTEMIIAHQENIRFVTSVQLGAVMLSQKHLGGKRISTKDLNALKQAIALGLAGVDMEVPQHPFDCAVICSGAGKTLAIMDARNQGDDKLSDPHGYVLKSTAVAQLAQDLQALGSPDKIRERWQLEASRSEIILAGATILAHIGRLFAVPKWIVSTYGLREGLVVDTISRLQSYQDHNPLLIDIRWRNILHLGERYRIDREQARRVTKFALALYDQLQALGYEGKGPRKGRKKAAASALAPNLLSDRELLRAAAWLYECGKFVNYSRYHRHSFYLIVNSRLMGYSQRERYMIGLIARFHRKAKALKTDSDCEGLSPHDFERMTYLATILRLAAAANRSRQGLIRQATLIEADKHLQIVIEGSGATPPAVDLYKLDKEKASLEVLLGLPIAITLRQAT